MRLRRRKLLKYLLAAPSLTLVDPPFAHAEEEEFPIFASEREQVDYKFRRREVDYQTIEPAGTIVVDSRKRFLYFVLGEGRAIRYGVGVGRRGFAWAGVAEIKRKAKWPTWTPTPDQLARSKVYERWKAGMPGGSGNPLGARALYLFQGNVDTLYRIHGTEVPTSIGHFVSSGCIRMLNVDVAELYDKVSIGTRVVVLEGQKDESAPLFDLFG